MLHKLIAKMELTIMTDDQFKELISTVKQVEDKVNKLLTSSQKESNDLLDNQDLCKMFKCTTRTLQNWRDKGLLKFIKPEGSNIIMYKHEDVEEFIVSNLSKRKSDG